MGCKVPLHDIRQVITVFLSPVKLIRVTSDLKIKTTFKKTICRQTRTSVAFIFLVFFFSFLFLLSFIDSS